MPTIWFAILVTLAVTSGGCATPPKTGIDVAKAAVDKAVAAKANEYAPQSLSAALDAQAKLDAELKVQDGHLPMMRSYSDAMKLAEVVTAAGKKAEEDAAKAEQFARSEASTLVVDAKAVIQDAEAQLDNAPKGKGARADLDVMKPDLVAAKSAVGEAETALAGQRYRDAKAKAEAATQTAKAIVTSMQGAREVRQTAKNRRR